MFEDFDVGDFVRLRIDHASVNVWTWVRVMSATVELDPDGTEVMTDVLLEVL